jgi:predicted lipid-binding transport protein (Tim44 family)
MSILTNSTPQFGTAEYGSQPGSERCKTCNQPLGARYYRVNGVLTCESCVEQVKAQTPKDTHAALMRGLMFGVGGALIGLTLYSAVGIITGLEIGYVSLAVGYIVGKAVMKGSRGIGGRRYQVTAVVLTYAAVSMAAIPIGISQIIKHREAKKASVAQDESMADDLDQPVDSEPAGAPKKSFAAALGMLVFEGLASPFLSLTDPVHGGIGLIILMVGIRIAWKLTDEKPVDIVGPFNNSAPAPSTASAG